jgi:hypothetical protein
VHFKGVSMDGYSYQKCVKRFFLLLKNRLFPSPSDKEVTSILLSLAEKDYTLEDFCSFIKEDFERLLSVSNDYKLSLREQENLCGLAFETIAIADENPKIAILIWFMFCCYHSPEEWIHETMNLDSALKGIYEYCLITEDREVLDIL